MPRPCTICSHEQRVEIESAIVAGTLSNRRIATQHGLSEAAVRRHADSHLSDRLAKAQDAVEVAQADDLLEQIKGLRNKAVKILLKAEKQGDFRTALAGIREARACIELLAELEGELDRRATVNVTINPQWLVIRTAILGALNGRPEAREAVVSALSEIPDAAD